MPNRNTYRRKNSLRLKNYDYSKQGLYFLTLCVQHNLHLYGYVENNEMICNDAGIMIYKWYDELENKFPTIHCDVAQVMPNHFHCIIEIRRDGPMWPPIENHVSDTDAHVVGTSLRGRPVTNETVSETKNGDKPEPTTPYGMHNKKYNASIPDAMEWFKTMTTNEYIRGVKQNHWQRFDGKLWQRSYYDHIIRDNESYERIRNYIINNPANLDNDKFNK